MALMNKHTGFDRRREEEKVLGIGKLLVRIFKVQEFYSRQAEEDLLFQWPD